MSESTPPVPARAWVDRMAWDACPQCRGKKLTGDCPLCLAHFAGCAKAWEEGYSDGARDEYIGKMESRPNPYLARRDNEQEVPK